ncbi:hypothetical protein [Arthrobacter ramosus]|uniref:Uncharacterized protein n=1 Tax=Arthrobacter ramosus TaxID=1672 RepID=A0ABV5Y3F7_ARTRM|nr:hypothetical protein [Arthrobacter ramosus]
MEENNDRRALHLVGLHNLPGIAGVTREAEPWHLDTDGRIATGARTWLFSSHGLPTANVF